MNTLDFSNQTPVQVLNMDFESIEGDGIGRYNGDENISVAGVGKGWNVLGLLHPLTYEELHGFIESVTEMPGIPESFFTSGGLSVEEFISRFAGHHQRAKKMDSQDFTGLWVWREDKASGTGYLQLHLHKKGLVVSGEISKSKDADDTLILDHIHLTGNKIGFTYRPKSDGRLLELKGLLEGDSLRARILGTESDYGEFVFYKEH